MKNKIENKIVNQSAKDTDLVRALKDENNALKNKIITLENDYEDLFSTNEELAGQVNSLTVKAEISRLEFVQIFDAVSDPLWIIDNQHTVLRVNRSFVELFKLGNKQAVIGKKCHDILNFNLCQTDNCPLKHILHKKERIAMEIDFPIAKGDTHAFLLTGAPLLGLAGETLGVVLQFKDISERRAYEEALKETNKKLKKQANIDGLTQISNRRFFNETLQKEWRRMQRSQKPIGLLMIDIDFFKLYNDNYGHAQGDECLKQIAKTIKSCARRSHDLAARYGGEEFAYILPETDLKGAAQVADSVLNAIRDLKIPHEYSKVANIATVSIGCFSMIPTTNDKQSDLIIKADQLLYKSKESGRNRFTTSK
ncbi:MAG: diguanylate cyclase [Desulfobacteraceae bacterium]|nr:diguanylate cyclase [Desulfobacteraceae bacterium]